ncbi:hypothetical protein [Polyangium jinanense]|uniref:Uncharacterized protein n=1 Tax=Polyangium jinanense TaxID=2829994 RepID=A0A9X3X973_9BACT|nr:hypothetical protein [Polyangium jinanense]MDC3958928.1 hypothetical protein [Polyangium jinanense]MDC3986042.1 hypothetical protein [Polyangium jinanense]
MDTARDIDDDAETTVMDRPALPPRSGVRASTVHPEPVRDTFVDPPSAWSRARAFAGALPHDWRERIRRARLSDRLPPLPPPRSTRATRVSAGAVGHDERGELLLLEIMRADPAYQRAAVYVANYATALRKHGNEAYAEGLVHYALSRMRPDAEGFVSFARLRDILCEMSVSGTLVPALLRLEKSGVVTITRTEETPSLPHRVQLRIPL